MRTTRNLVQISLRGLLVLTLLMAIALGVWMNWVRNRRLAFDELRRQGAVVYMSNHPPAAVDWDWGPVFEMPDRVSFYVRVVGSKVRIGETMFSPDEAEKYLLEQKGIATKFGSNDTQMYVAQNLGDDCDPRINVRMLNFGGKNFDVAGTWNWDVYMAEWNKNVGSGNKDDITERRITKR